MSRKDSFDGLFDKKQSLPNIRRQATKVTCTLHEFFAVWASLQSWEIPEFHIDVLDFLSEHDKWDNNTGVLEVFRGAAKSTITGLFITWMLTQNPTLRFLVLSADKELATKITTDIKEIVSRHPLAKHLLGKEGTWRSDKLVVEGHTDGRNPNVAAWGILSNVTGARADFIIYDDVEVQKNCATEGDRQKLRKKLNEPVHILVPGGKHLFIGTPHSFDSIYTELEGNSGKDNAFRSGGASVLKIPLISNITGEFPTLTGTSAWPDRFTDKEVLNRQANSGTKGEFMSQYLLIPYNPSNTRLDPTLIAGYNHELEVHTANGATVARIGDVRVLGVSVFWDPAMSSISTDDSVLAIVFSSDDGHYFIHRVVRIDGDADQQCKQVIEEMTKCAVSHVVIETNGIGNFLPPLMRKHCEGKGISVEGQHTSQNKAQKILHAYEVPMSAGRLHAHTSVMNSRFRTQLRDFSPRSVNTAKNDFIDAPAMAILAQPIRLRAGTFGSRANQWQQYAAAGTIEASTQGIEW